MANFEEATKNTEELFDNQLTIEEPQEGTQLEAEEEPQTEQEPQEEATAEAAALENATVAAEAAAQAATERENQLSELSQEIEALKNQNIQLQGTIDELSKRNEQAITEEAFEPPTIDLNGLAFADEETQRTAQNDYASRMADYTRKQVMKELEPFLEQAKSGIREKEKNELITALEEMPELEGLRDMLPQIEAIIKKNPALSAENVPLDEKYITAYAIAKGVNSMNNPPKTPGTNELMELYRNNPEFRDMIEKERLEEVKKSQQVPPLSASSGAVNAALNIKEAPKTLKEASERTRPMFGLD